MNRYVNHFCSNDTSISVKQGVVIIYVATHANVKLCCPSYANQITSSYPYIINVISFMQYLLLLNIYFFRPPIDKTLKTEKNKALAAQTRVISKPSQPPPPPKKVTPPSPIRAAKGPAITKTGKHVPKAGGDASKTKGKAEQEVSMLLIMKM